jgi:peptidoglycan/LPS O-acetylase OafA/YrhL
MPILLIFSKIIVQPLNRFNALTGFRCLAATMVFLYHNRKYWRENLHPEFLRLLNEFHIGVTLFFVLSGFLIAYTYGHKPMRSGKAYARYMLVRIARIMPLYWLILTAFYLSPDFGNRKFTWLTYSLFHGFSNKLNFEGIAQAWSLNVELTFYVLAPLLCLLQRKHILYLLGSLLLLFLLCWGGGETWFRINGNPSGFFYPLSFIFKGVFPGRCTEFLAGMILAHTIQDNKANLFTRWPLKTITGFLGIFLTAYGIGFFQSAQFEHGTEQPGGLMLHVFLLPFFIMLALAGLIYERTWLQRFFSTPALILLGNASFAFYLVHISYVSIQLRKLILLPDRNFVLLWLISILLYLLIEKPIYERCRKWLKK